MLKSEDVVPLETLADMMDLVSTQFKKVSLKKLEKKLETLDWLSKSVVLTSLFVKRVSSRKLTSKSKNLLKLILREAHRGVLLTVETSRIKIPGHYFEPGSFTRWVNISRNHRGLLTAIESFLKDKATLLDLDFVKTAHLFSAIGASEACLSLGLLGSGDRSWNCRNEDLKLHQLMNVPFLKNQVDNANFQFMNKSTMSTTHIVMNSFILFSRIENFNPSGPNKHISSKRLILLLVRAYLESGGKEFLHNIKEKNRSPRLEQTIINEFASLCVSCGGFEIVKWFEEEQLIDELQISLFVDVPKAQLSSYMKYSFVLKDITLAALCAGNLPVLEMMLSRDPAIATELGQKQVLASKNKELRQKQVLASMGKGLESLVLKNLITVAERNSCLNDITTILEKLKANADN